MNNKAFTLIEMMVAVAVFSSVMTAATGIFVSGLKAQRQNLAIQQVLDQTSYVAEYMSRAIRMAKKDLWGDCLTTYGAKYNYETNPERDRIRFLNYQDKCQEFFLEDGQLKERRSTDSTAVNFGDPIAFTSSDLWVTFEIGSPDSWDQYDTDQPRVTFLLEIEGKEYTKAKIQSTLSQRNLDIQK